jgi:predicted RND superfamily exporter protein
MAGAYSRFLRKLAHFQVENPVISVLIILFLTVAIYGGVSSVMTVASLEKMMPSDVEEINAFNTLRDNNLGQDIIAIVIEIDRDSVNPNGVVDIRDKRVVEYTRDLSVMLKQEVDVREVYSISDFIPKDFPEESLPAIMSSEHFSEFISDDYSKTVVMILTDISADDVRMNSLSSKIKQDIEDSGVPAGVEIKLTGTPVIQQKLGELISKDRSSTQWISTLFVFLITMIIFGTFSSALVPIIAVTISVNWLYGTMGYVGLPISTLAGGVAAMVVGIGIDFAIHIMNKFKYERKKGYPIKESIELAVVETGTALTATSMTTIAAFLAFLSGAMPEMGRFGMLMAIGISYALIFSLAGLPALLVLEEKIIYYLKKKMRFGVEGELHLEKARRTKK